MIKTYRIITRHCGVCYIELEFKEYTDKAALARLVRWRRLYPNAFMHLERVVKPARKEVTVQVGI